MKYKIKSKKIIHRQKGRSVAAYGLAPLTKRRREDRERILLETLFELSVLEEPRPQKRKRFVGRRIFTGRRKRKEAFTSPFWAGLLVSAVSVCLLSALGAYIGLFGRFFMPHRTITVPSFTGLYEHQLKDMDGFEFAVSYEYSSDTPAGEVISQSPRANAERRLYLGDGECKVELKISAGRRYSEVPELVLLNGRDALLTLKNMDIPVKVIKEYSSSIPEGRVISSSPAPSQRIYDGELLTLRVSLGEESHTTLMPSLLGLSESEAADAVMRQGLRLGRVTYQSSTAPYGKVIAQQYEPHAELDEGESVDVTVSLGNTFAQKKIPELYGMSVDEAAEALRGVGLVIGNIYSVTSHAPAGTVISQTPIPLTPIDPSITSVDIYVSR